MSHYLSEAFKKLDVLNEDTFAINTNGLEDFVKFEDVDELEDSIDVIDTEAETIDDLQDSYVGKVILDCCVCHSKIYKDVEDVVIEDDIANANEECPFCYTTDGYKVIGQVASFDETEEKETEEKDETEVEEKDDKIDEGLFGIKTKYRKWTTPESKSIKESVNNINVETDNDIINVTPDDNGSVTVSTEPKISPVDDEEVITPVEPEIQAEISDNAADGEEIEIDMDEFDEESFDELGEGYLKKVYENVNSFKTANVSFIKNKLIVEGIIKFNSGKSKKTNFIFESREATKSGKVRFIGENKEIARGRKSFTITGKVDNKKFMSESFNYNYGVRGANGKAQRLYGTVRKGN